MLEGARKIARPTDNDSVSNSELPFAKVPTREALEGGQSNGDRS